MKQLKQVILALSVFGSRFVGLPANFSPLGSFGFFGSNAILYFLAIVVHDYLRGGFYPGFWLTYVGFAAYAILGRIARKRWQTQVVLLPLASFLFFLFSNLGVWWYWYPHTSSALVSCFLLAVPFYRNTLLGDLFFGYGYLVTRWLFTTQIHFTAQPQVATR